MEPMEAIKKLRANGMTTAEIAEKTGCKRNYIEKILYGTRQNPSYIIVDKLRQLAEKATA